MFRLNTESSMFTLPRKALKFTVAIIIYPEYFIHGRSGGNVLEAYNFLGDQFLYQHQT